MPKGGWTIPRRLPGARSMRRVQDGLALACGALFCAVIYGPRLPPGPEMLLPKRFGYAGFLVLMRLWSAPAVPAALSWAAVACAAGLLAALAAGVALELRERRAKPLSGARAALRGFGAALGAAAAFWLARWALTGITALIERAWFFPEALDWREPLLLLGGFCAVLLAAARAAGRLAAWSAGGGGRSGLSRWLPWACALAAAAVLGLGLSSYVSASAAPPDRGGAPRLVCVLAQKDGRPRVEERLVEVPAEPSPEPVAPTAAALRLLYEERTIEMDADGLRRALSLGVSRGDPLARALLLENLLAAPADARTRRLLDSLCDPKRWRVGARAAARLALGYARLGDGDRAAYWLSRASRGEGAPPPGLLALPDARTVLRRGRIFGRLRADGPARVALYARREPGQPYLLGPAQLVASSDVGAGGRFDFKDLTEGDYYLAFAVEAPSSAGASRRPLRVRGSRGDLELSRRRRAIGVRLEARR